MTIEQLNLVNYRSYRDHRFGLHPNLTVVIGPNATGKTNLLEALYVLAQTKSFRARDADLIRHDQDFFRIEAGHADGAISLIYQPTAKPAKRLLYDQTKRPLVRHLGTLPVVLFEPGDLLLINGSPSLRRRYLDSILCQTDPIYLRALTDYGRVLRQRNSLLENFNIASVKDQIFAWDVNLTNLAAELYDRRQRFITYLNGVVGQSYDDIAGEAADLALEYLPSITVANYAEDFMTALVSNLTRDLAAGFTTIGPHREDFRVRFKNNDMMAIASRGEVRSAVLALKLAELGYLEERLAKPPLLLLDDVFSELDVSRRHYLTQKLPGYQTLITTTDADIAREIAQDHAIIKTAEVAKYAVA